MLKLAKYLKKYRKQVIIGPFFKLLEAIFELIVPVVMASIIDVGIAEHNIGYVYKMGGVILLLGIFGLIFALICQYSAAVASQGFGTIVRNKLFSHINSFSYKELDKLGTNSLITRMTNDVNQMQLAVAMLIRLVVRAPFIVIGATIMSILIDFKMSLIFAIMIPIVILLLYLVMNKSIPYYRIRQEKLDRVSLITRENLEGSRVIRAFSKQERENRRFKQASLEVTETAARVGTISAILNPGTFSILSLGIVAIVWFGGIRVNLGNLTRGQVIALVSYTTQISLTLIVVANLVVIFTKASVSAKRINEVLDTKPDMREGEKTRKDIPAGENVKIEFNDVSFSYSNSEEYALRNINLQIKKGQTVGIIGGTGSGKSTLINLIPRFYDVSKGIIEVDGINVKEYKFEELRNQFGIVPQHAVLFEGSILDNLKWADESADITQIQKAIDTAQAVEVIENREGKLNSKIVQGGKNLSGGQKQRLTIARALAGNPEVLILDDSSSALDYATDARLRTALHNYNQDLTVIIVSQRTNSIKHADLIITLDDGKIAGIGTHEELYESCDAYRQICLSQLSKEEVHK